jgi:hypothetical protein
MDEFGDARQWLAFRGRSGCGANPLRVLPRRVGWIAFASSMARRTTSSMSRGKTPKAAEPATTSGRRTRCRATLLSLDTVPAATRCRLSTPRGWRHCHRSASSRSVGHLWTTAACLDRYAAQNANSVLVACPHSGPSCAQRGKDIGNQPRGSEGISRCRALGWFCTGRRLWLKGDGGLSPGMS